MWIKPRGLDTARSSYRPSCAAVIYTLCESFLAITLLAGCGSSSNGSVPPRIAEKADVVITYDGQRHTCLVTLFSEAQGNAVQCGEVVPFVRDELRLASGSVYDTRTNAAADEPELARVSDNLKGAGYRFIGGHRDR